MAPYDDWNDLDQEEDEELQDPSVCSLNFYRLTPSHP